MKLYRCQRGHEQSGEEWSYQALYKDNGRQVIYTGPLCHECWELPENAKAIAEFARDLIGTQPVEIGDGR